jgi:2-polyprenyl-3-methyl-5-hydroxy-6-metoxy-1,4-benzoquinol methylase
MTKCYICGKEKLDNNNKVTGVWPKTKSVLYCASCELYMLQEMPSDSELEDFYINHYHQYSSIISFSKNIFRWFRSASQYKYLNNVLKDLKDKSILEIGSFDGMLLKFFKNNNTVIGLDYNSNVGNSVLFKSGIPIHNKDFFSLDTTYDLIIMSHVIEHLPDLNKSIKKLNTLLNKNGHLFIEVPNSPKYPERDVNYIDGYLTTPHTFNFTPKSLRKAFEKHNLRITSLDRVFYNFPYGNRFAEKLGFLFLTGVGLDLITGILGMLYVIKTIFNPFDSYKKVPMTARYIGPGDCLRIIVTKK